MWYTDVSSAASISEASASTFLILSLYTLGLKVTHWLFAKRMYTHYEVHYKFVQHLFTLTLLLCITLLQLLLLELLDILNPTFRRWAWNTTVFLILLLVYLILPIAFVHTIVKQRSTSVCTDGTTESSSTASSRNLSYSEYDGLCIDPSVPHTKSYQRLQTLCTMLKRCLPSTKYFKTMIGSLILLPCLWFFFFKLGAYLLGSAIELTATNFSEQLLMYMGVCGITIVSALAGFGAVHYPYRNICTLMFPVKASDVLEMEDKLTQISDLLNEKKQLYTELKKLKQETEFFKSNGYQYPPKSLLYPPESYLDSLASSRNSGFMHKINSLVYPEIEAVSVSNMQEMMVQDAYLRRRAVEEKQRVDDGGWYRPVRQGEKSDLTASHPETRDTMSVLSSIIQATRSAFTKDDLYATETDLRILKNEIIVLDGLCKEYSIELDDLSKQLMKQTSRRCPLFMYIHLGFTWVMVFICCYRITSATINVVVSHVNHVDPSTRVMNALFSYFHLSIEVSFWAPYVSLIVMGVIIVLNIRGFTQKALTAFRYFSAPLSSNILATLIAEVMLLYFSACVLLLRMYLPSKYKESVTELLGSSMNFDAFHLHFDMVFVISCITTFIGLSLSLSYKLNRFNVN